MKRWARTPGGGPGRRAAGVLAAAVLLGGGCRAAPRSPPEAVPFDPAEAHIQVLQVLPAENSVLVECVPPLPGGTGVELFREGRPVGTLRMTAVRRPGLAAAEILSGEPRPGDRGRMRPPTPEETDPP